MFWILPPSVCFGVNSRSNCVHVFFFYSHDLSAGKHHTSKDTLTSETLSSDEEQLRRDFFGEGKKPQSTSECMGPAILKLPALKPNQRNIFGYVDETLKVDYMVPYFVTLYCSL